MILFSTDQNYGYSVFLSGYNFTSNSFLTCGISFCSKLTANNVTSACLEVVAESGDTRNCGGCGGQPQDLEIHTEVSLSKGAYFLSAVSKPGHTYEGHPYDLDIYMEVSLNIVTSIPRSAPEQENIMRSASGPIHTNGVQHKNQCMQTEVSLRERDQYRDLGEYMEVSLGT
jgi:hypothetical protein